MNQFLNSHFRLGFHATLWILVPNALRLRSALEGVLPEWGTDRCVSTLLFLVDNQPDLDSAWEQKKLEARKLLENRESPKGVATMGRGSGSLRPHLSQVRRGVVADLSPRRHAVGLDSGYCLNLNMTDLYSNGRFRPLEYLFSLDSRDLTHVMMMPKMVVQQTRYQIQRPVS